MTVDQRFRVVAYESQRVTLWDKEDKAFVTIRFDESAIEFLRIPRRKRSEKKSVAPIAPKAPVQPMSAEMFRPAALPQGRPVE